MGSIRAAVRVLCVNERDQVLLIRWRDPTDGRYVWEPPGGGIEPGERAIDAARRELSEETGLSGSAITGRSMMVHRDAWWNGARYLGEEAFFLARYESPPEVSCDRLEPYEMDWLDRHEWVAWDDIRHLPDEVEPPHILAVLTDLDPHGPWAAASNVGDTP